MTRDKVLGRGKTYLGKLVTSETGYLCKDLKEKKDSVLPRPDKAM